jgi:hypothetical protein
VLNPDGSVDICCACEAEATEACCVPFVSCFEETPEFCVAQQGTPQGPQTTCLGPVACCLPNGDCIFIDERCCDDAGGVSQGQGSDCDPSICPQPPQACCLQGGTCEQMRPEHCRLQDGTPKGSGSTCSADLCAADEPCEHCGGGDHWVDTCPGGQDTMPTEALVGIAFNDDCVPSLNLRMPGPVTIQRDPGDPSTHSIATEIVSMTLSGGGVTMLAGAGGGVGGVLRPSLGLIREQSADPAMADSFFDVYVEVSGAGLPGPLYNHQSITVQAKIPCLPPQTRYIHIDSCIPMYDSPVVGQGTIVAWLVAPDHTTYPTQACCLEGGVCEEMRPEHCRLRDGAPGGPDSACTGDKDNNGVDDACEENVSCDDCGRGDHWVDQCPESIDRMPSRALAGLSLDNDCTPEISLILRGPVTVRRDQADKASHSIATEIVAMSLSGGGVTMRAGAGGGIGGVLRPSLGLIREQSADPTMADSFFNVFVEITAPGLPFPVYNQDPLRVQSKIDCVPPDTRYIHVRGCIPLYDSPFPNALPDPVAWLVSPDHTTYPTQEPCDDCGPGPHWVDECAAGVDEMPSGATVGIDLDLDCRPDTSLVLRGPVLIRRSAPLDDSLNFPGTRPNDGHLETLDTEIVSMTLSGGGVVFTAGAGLGRGGVLSPSLGVILEQSGDDRAADSFFDMFFEIDLGAGRFAYNLMPLRVESKIDCIPPDATYIHPTGCLPLYDSPVPGAGDIIAQLVTADHSTFPACGDPGTGDCRRPNGTPYCDDAECCDRVCATDPFCCGEMGGVWDDICVELAKLGCPKTLEACCLPEGRCVDVTPEACTQRDGVPRGSGSVCKGDHNGNGVDDACDLLGDMDGDGDVDNGDWRVLLRCLRGPAVPVESGCEGADLNWDGRVDMEDVRIYQGALTK